MASIAVIGAGYVGLTTAVCFAHLGHDVVCADVVPDKVERLSRGEPTILERGLDDLLREGLKEDRLRFVLGAAAAVADAEFVYLCVPTPQSSDGSADMSYIEAAAGEIAPRLRDDAIVVNKSTVPVGSTRLVERALGRAEIAVVSNPEFLREGSAVADFLKPDRMVIGADDQNAAIRVAALYIGVPAPLMVTDPASAEMIKYASNAFLATKLSFVNAVAAVCEGVGADVNDVVLGMGYDKRIGSGFLKPGPGWGGSCFIGSETVLARRNDRTALLAFEELAEQLSPTGVTGWEVLAWGPGEPTPAFYPISAFTQRPVAGDVIEVRTKMGRRVTVTPDHPFVVSDGGSDGQVGVRLAHELEGSDDLWVPLAQGAPLPDDRPASFALLDGLDPAGIGADEVQVRLGERQRRAYQERRELLASTRRHDVNRTGVLRLDELRDLGIGLDGGAYGTVNNGAFVPAGLEADDVLWRVLGLFLAEGHISVDGRLRRVSWSFHRENEDDLVGFVAGYWQRHGVKVRVARLTTTCQVSVTSRILASWFEHVLRVGRNCYEKRVPDAIWSATDRAKRALLRGLWDGDGSWSLVNGGPSVAVELGTASARLADGVLRLLGELGLVASQRIGRTAKPTVDTHWLRISGADQIERALFLFPEDEREEIRATVARQSKRIAPTGHRPLTKGVTWVRVVGTRRRAHHGPVYSVEVPGPHTVVTTAGLVVHNCFPKDTRAMLRIAEDGGYDFAFLRGVLAVNEEQFERVVGKVVDLAGGSVAGVTVAAWGLTFKAGTDDLRESPALEVIDRLVSRGARVRAHDPAISALTGHPGVEVVDDPYAACEGASVLVVLTEWDQYKWLDLDKVAEVMDAPRVVDSRNLLDRAALVRRGFACEAVGRS